MPNRYIRESAIESDAVNSLSWQGEVFYRRLLNRVDDFGRFTANPALLRASVFPLQLDKVREIDLSRLLAECEKAGLLYVYATDSKATLIVNKWEQGRAKESKHPSPPADVCERMKTYVYMRKHPPTYVSDSDSDPDANSDPDADHSAREALVDSIYAAYPRKVARPEALKAIARALKAIAGPTLLERTQAFASAAALWGDDDRKFIPHPATWFNQARYDDDPETWKRTTPEDARGRALFA